MTRPRSPRWSPSRARPCAGRRLRRCCRCCLEHRGRGLSPHPAPVDARSVIHRPGALLPGARRRSTRTPGRCSPSARPASRRRIGCCAAPGRMEAGEFLAEGAPAVTEAIGYARENPGAVIELYVTESAAAKHVEVIRAAFAAGVEVTQVSERAAAALSDAVDSAGHPRPLRDPGHRPGCAAGGLTDAAGGAGAGPTIRQRGHRHPARRRQPERMA